LVAERLSLSLRTRATARITPTGDPLARELEHDVLVAAAASGGAPASSSRWSRQATATVVLAVVAAALFIFVIGMIEGGFDPAQVVIVLLVAAPVGRTLRAGRRRNTDLAVAPPRDLQPIPVGGSLAEPEPLDWLNQETIELALREGHLRRDIPTWCRDEVMPAVHEWLEQLESAAAAEGRCVIGSGSYLAEYGILGVSVVNEAEGELWGEHPLWSYRRVQRVVRRRARSRKPPRGQVG
jgi:hypothetical protein